MSQRNLSPATLIVGSDSLIGKALVDHLKVMGEEVIGTTRRRDKIGDVTLFLDLSENPDKWECPRNISVAVICAGITKLAACKADPGLTSHINVRGIVALVKNLVSKGVHVIFLSSNQVFDGNVPYRKPNDPYSPITEYGRQKAETERKIRNMGDFVAIVRFTKILGPEYPLFSTWAKSLREGKPVHPFSDMYMAPVPLSYAISILRLIGDKRISGILQVSGDCDISHAEAAYIGSEVLETDSNLVQPVKASESGYSSTVIPNNTTLNIDRLKSLPADEPPDIRWTIKTAFQTL